MFWCSFPTVFIFSIFFELKPPRELLASIPGGSDVFSKEPSRRGGFEPRRAATGRGGGVAGSVGW